MLSVAALVLPISLFLAPALGANTTVVDLGYAQYYGNEWPRTGVKEYLGIAYAAPPLGNLRWRAPVPPVTNRTPQNATVYQPICAGAGSYGAAGQSEDCLYASVFTPSNATSSSKLPVMVWFQGGGFTSNSNANYNGTTLVQKGPMVVVTFNYRVGAFGFLANEKVQANGELNVGLLDQRMLLHWVQTYVSQFGGDPAHVVIDGASAGAASVFLQMSAYGGRNDNLFIGGVTESVWTHAQPAVSELEYQWNTFVSATGCASARDTTLMKNDTMACLRSADFTTLWKADMAHPYPGKAGSPLFPYGPAIDGKFVNQTLYEAFRDGNFVNVPMIIGSTTDEGRSFAPNASSPDQVTNWFLNNVEDLQPATAASINRLYPLSIPLPRHAAYFSAAASAYGESTFICPANILSTYAAAWSPPSMQIYHYRYAVLSTENVAAGMGTTHTFEIGAVWGPANARGPSTYVAPGINAPIVPVVMDYWVSFVTTLDPNPRRADDAPEWEPLNLTAPSRLRIRTNDTAMEDWPVDQAVRCGFWEGLAWIMKF